MGHESTLTAFCIWMESRTSGTRKDAIFENPSITTAMKNTARKSMFQRSITISHTLLHNPSVKEPDGTVGIPGITGIVGYHANGCAAAMQFAQQFHNSFAVGGIQVSSRLVRQQDGGVACQSSRHGDALLLTSR